MFVTGTTVQQETNEEELVLRLDRFERTVATCLCVVPFLFSAQCLLVAISCPVFANMFKDFGAKLPWLTQFVIDTWQVWGLVGVAVPIASLVFARRGRGTSSIVFSTVSGLVVFILAQVLTVSLFLPIFELGTVAGGTK